ncbi:uncharacterized protein [Spinacia oleracea]|uniref:Aspartic peptidase DDI1-type domain-containing protein n=1 Tax=Spinacia oleracea TaxID=3562 RepID=A0ABM3QQV2_SPIOL|nr:uncharacterized protein LOC130461624 [Spinacia oleracea]
MNAIVTRSGKILDDVPRANKVSKPNGEDQEGVIESSDIDAVEEEPPINDEGDTTTPKVATLLPLPTPKLPYPQRFIRHKLDVQFAKFLDVLRKLHITLPFTDALKQMPTYSRFPREILSGKRNCDVKETELEISNALCDLGASVSLMPYSVFSKLEVGDLVPTNITLQLADRSVKYPIGKIDDVPLRVGGFVIPVDFVVLDINEDVHVPIILGLPFLATAGDIIDVKQGNITLKVGMDSLFFDLNKTMSYPSSTNEKCFVVDSFDPLVHDMHEHLLTTNDPLEFALLNRDGLGDQGVEAAKYKRLMDSTPPCDQSEQCLLVLDGRKALDDHAPKLGVSPTLCMHHIELEDNVVPHCERQRKLNPPMGEVVKKEIMKLLAAGVIYPISNSRWVSPVHVVPKKG